MYVVTMIIIAETSNEIPAIAANTYDAKLVIVLMVLKISVNDTPAKLCIPLLCSLLIRFIVALTALVSFISTAA